MRLMLVLLALLASPAAAAPDPASFKVPDLSGSDAPAVVANGWKYFVFRKDGVSFAEAHADLSECFRYLQPTGWDNVILPRFVPWQQKTATRSIETLNPYGLVGDIMLGAIEGTLVRRDRQSRMRRCMETRDYVRYGIAEETWENIIAQPPEQAIGVMAVIAAGPDFGGKVPVK